MPRRHYTFTNIHAFSGIRTQSQPAQQSASLTAIPDGRQIISFRKHSITLYFRVAVAEWSGRETDSCLQILVPHHTQSHISLMRKFGEMDVNSGLVLVASPEFRIMRSVPNSVKVRR
ncbi:hypothetical protein TNCV_3388461 [Trichonephila clavipes]|nr:hypothetical protein TNCV_3388461 [Trichonephila clavipes]